MGLLDSLAGEMLGGGATGGQGGLVDAIGGLLHDPQNGGLDGLVAKFEQQGLGHVIGSWIGSGQNLPITPEQLQAVLGNEQVLAIAQKLGFTPQELSAKLAQLLPQVVDHVTPGGSLPEAGALGGLGGLAGMLKGFGL